MFVWVQMWVPEYGGQKAALGVILRNAVLCVRVSHCLGAHQLGQKDPLPVSLYLQELGLHTQAIRPGISMWVLPTHLPSSHL